MEAILYIGHGTRSKKGAEDARAFIERVMARIPVPIQELCFLELTAPLIGDGFRQCVIRGATSITIIPLFLLAAGHIKKDIPDALAPLRDEFPTIPIHVTDSFGVQESLLDAAAELIQSNAGALDAKDSLLIVGRGSSDQEIANSFSKIAAGLQMRLGVEHVSVCYLAAAKPRFDEAIEEIATNASGRVIVLPYLLFSGLLLNEINQKVRSRQKLGQNIIHTGALSGHREIENIVILRATEREATA